MVELLPGLARIVAATAVTSMLAGSLHAQDLESSVAVLDSLLRANAYPLQWDDDEASGPGFDLIMEASADAQFVVLGEQHLTREIPAFATAWFRALHASNGFNYVALEEGPVLAGALSTAAYRGDRAAVVGYVRRFPNAVHLLSEAEVEMIADLGAISDAVTPIWGVNQVYGAAHVLDSLASLAPDSEAAAVVDELLAKALSYEGERFAQNVHYLVDVATEDDLERLGKVMASSDEAQRLIAALALSHRIFRPYAEGANPEFGAFFRSARLREESMKATFAARYRQAQRHGDALPRVLVKSGNVHARRGLTPATQLQSFGTFLHELAQFNDRPAFFVSAHVYNDESPYRVPTNSWFRPIVDAAAPDAWTVFDLRPLQPWTRSSRLAGLSAELQELLRGYDALLIIGGGTQSTVDAFRTPNFRWFPG